MQIFKKRKYFIMVLWTLIVHSGASVAMETTSIKGDFSYFSEQFADLKILRYNIPDFDSLSLQQRKLAYYLSRAALSGRDIYWDQNYKHNLTIRRILEQIMLNFSGDRNSDLFNKFSDNRKYSP